MFSVWEESRLKLNLMVGKGREEVLCFLPARDISGNASGNGKHYEYIFGVEPLEGFSVPFVP